MTRFIIDGYNALFSLRPFLKGTARSREGFLLYIKTARPFGSLRNSVTVVFDGAKGIVSGQQGSFSPLRIIFSKGETADETIVRLISREEHPNRTVVVTDDRELAERAKNLGAQAVAVSDFFSSLVKKKRTTQDTKPTPESREGKRITEEMKKEWNIDD